MRSVFILDFHKIVNLEVFIKWSCTSNQVANMDCTNFSNDRKWSNEIVTLDNVDFIVVCLFSKIGCFMKVAGKTLERFLNLNPQKQNKKMGQLFG